MRLLNIVLLMLCVSISSFAQLERKYATDGRIVYNQILRAQNSSADFDEKAGVYIVHVNDGQKTYVEKITIN